MNIAAALALLLAGISLTAVSAYFGIMGFLDFFPFDSLFYGILAAGIALEIAKVSSSVFIFHQGRESKERKFPLSFRVFMTGAVMGMMILSATFTYTHLTEPVGSYELSTEVSTEKEDYIKQRLDDLRTEKVGMDTQLNNLPVDYAKARRDLYDKYKPRYDVIEQQSNELRSELEEIIASKSEVKTEGDKLKFMKHMAESLPFVDDYKQLYTFTVILLVALIDPSAIVLTIAATFLLGQALRDRQERLHQEKDLPEEDIDELIDDVDELIEEVDQIIEEVVPESSTEDEIVDKPEPEEEAIEEVVTSEPEPEIKTPPRKLTVPSSVESTISTEGEKRKVQRNAEVTAQFTSN